VIPAWVAAYVGLPFREYGRDRDGVDCWGLCRLVWAERFGITVPSYSDHYTSTEDREELGRLVRGERGPWREIPAAVARAGDGLLFRVQGEPIHVGVVVDAPWFLHVERGVNACVDQWDSPRWARRLLGVYRHEALDTDAALAARPGDT
jgi:cell wall-associated NlpC family hydrolase